MKNLMKLSPLMLLFVVLISACSKSPDKVLVKKDGVWTGNFTTTTSVTGQPDNVITGTEQITFKKDGTGSYVDSNNNTVNFTWTYSDAATSVTIVENGNSYTYVVTDMKAKSETWTSTASVTISGITTTITQVIKLTK